MITGIQCAISNHPMRQRLATPGVQHEMGKNSLLMQHRNHYQTSR